MMNLNYNTYHTFENEGNYYLYDNETLTNCIIDKRVYEALKNNNPSLLTEQELQMFEMFKNNKLFFVDNPMMSYKFPEYDSVIISMALSHGCNLNCKYCFAESGNNYKDEQREFTEHSINAALEFLLHNRYFSDIENYRINLVGGGEPLLNKKLFRTFIRTAFSKFEKEKKHLYVWFSTNGTLLTEDDLIFLSNYDVGYGISIDGEKIPNDYIRTYKDGSGTYDDIVKTIRIIQSSSKIPKRLKELWGLMVYTRKNANLLENISHLQRIGFSTLQMRFVRTDNCELSLAETELISTEICNFIRVAFDNAINDDLSLLKLICNNNDYIGKLIIRIITKTPVYVRCEAGVYMLSFSANGDIFPCDCFVGNDNYKIGNFYSDFYYDRMDIYNKLSVFDRPKCNCCWAKCICGGDCYHNSYINNGCLLTPDQSYCEIILKCIEIIIACVNKLLIHNRNGYNELERFITTRINISNKIQ